MSAVPAADTRRRVAVRMKIVRVVAERRRGESAAGDGQRGRRDSSEEHGERWFQWSFAPASARALLKGNQVGLQRWMNARDGTQTRRGRRRCGVA